jgi:hypothetical protein
MQPFITFWAVTALTQGTAGAAAARLAGGTPAVFLAGSFLACFFIEGLALFDFGGVFFFAIALF